MPTARTEDQADQNSGRDGVRLVIFRAVRSISRQTSAGTRLTSRPNRQQLKSISPHPVVDPISNAFQVEPPHIRRTCLLNADSDVWLRGLRGRFFSLHSVARPSRSRPPFRLRVQASGVARPAADSDRAPPARAVLSREEVLHLILQSREPIPLRQRDQSRFKPPSARSPTPAPGAVRFRIVRVGPPLRRAGACPRRRSAGSPESLRSASGWPS